MAEELVKFGIKVDVMENEIIVYPGKLQEPKETLSSHNDHRIAMAAAIATTVCTEPVTILGAEAVNKSYPSFWKEYQRLGGHYEQYLR